jgi:hypothetical protein
MVVRRKGLNRTPREIPDEPVPAGEEPPAHRILQLHSSVAMRHKLT